MAVLHNSSTPKTFKLLQSAIHPWDTTGTEWFTLQRNEDFVDSLVLIE